jgi:hypothetical protein
MSTQKDEAHGQNADGYTAGYTTPQAVDAEASCGEATVKQTAVVESQAVERGGGASKEHEAAGVTQGQAPDAVSPNAFSEDPTRPGETVAIQKADRDETGKFLLGNRGAYRHGARLFQETAELPEALRPEIEHFNRSLRSDQGELTTLRSGYVDRITELEAIIRLLGAEIAKNGILTKRGRVRTTYNALMSAIDRWDRLAQRLGMDRRLKPIADLAAYLANNSKTTD